MHRFLVVVFCLSALAAAQTKAPPKSKALLKCESALSDATTRGNNFFYQSTDLNAQLEKSEAANKELATKNAELSKKVDDFTVAARDATERLVNASRLGRAAAQTPEALAKQSISQRRHSKARSSWDASSQPAWLTPELFSQKIQPLLAAMSSSAIARQISVSRWYAGRIREGYRPHPRHWQALAKLAGFTADNFLG